MKKRTDGRYQLSVMIGYNVDGTPKRKVVYGKTQKDVTKKASDLRVKHSMGLVIDSDITLGEWAETWLATYKSGVAYNTKRMYVNIVDNYIVAPLGSLKLKDIKTAHLQKVVNDNAHIGRTMKLFMQTIKQIFDQAIANDIVFKNPALGITVQTVAAKVEKRALTDEEAERIYSLKLDSKTKCLVFLLMYTGMRRGEVLAISKSDIDMDMGVIRVSNSVVFKGNKSEMKSAKTKSSVREIPILDPLKPILAEYMHGLKSELLFTCADGSSFSLIAYRRLFAKFTNAMGDTDITAHIFRHNFATILYNADVDIKSAQYILGHSSITVTMDIYTKLDKRKKAKAAERLNTFLAAERLD
jgi:integrase